MEISNKHFTEARIGLPRTGTSISVSETLNFKLAHAFARDAVYSSLDPVFLRTNIEAMGLEAVNLKSRAADRDAYLKRPDHGRLLANESIIELKNFPNNYDLAIVVADGLSASAVEENFLPVLEQIVPMFQKSKLKLAPVSIVEQGRVAIADEIGGLLKVKVSLIFIGERPGLSSANSMGCYLTYEPKSGLTDEARNCISNIRLNGMTHLEASNKIFYLTMEMLRRKLSGVSLKDEQNLIL